MNHTKQHFISCLLVFIIISQLPTRWFDLVPQRKKYYSLSNPITICNRVDLGTSEFIN